MLCGKRVEIAEKRFLKNGAIHIPFHIQNPMENGHLKTIQIYPVFGEQLYTQQL
jgi:hypothetical protein